MTPHVSYAVSGGRKFWVTKKKSAGFSRELESLHAIVVKAAGSRSASASSPKGSKNVFYSLNKEDQTSVACFQRTWGADAGAAARRRGESVFRNFHSEEIRSLDNGQILS